MTDWPRIQSALDAGDVVLLPTETVYGLAAKANNSGAVSKIYAIKGRDFDKPLAVCVRNIDQARDIAEFDKISLRLAEKHWPGSLTLVLSLRKDANLDPRVTSNIQGLRTVALRCPEANWRRHIDTPLALTSANRSGEPDCVSYQAAMEELGDDIAASLGTDAPLSGAPSTVLRVDAGKFTVLRQGALKVTP
jgi:L-threonylcarbamoyladenylate synthase